MHYNKWGEPTRPEPKPPLHLEAGPQVRETAPGVWAVGPWPHVAVWQSDYPGESYPWWECQQCQVKTMLPYNNGCEHIQAVVKEWARGRMALGQAI